MVLSELRDEFWILRARETIKKVLHRCLPCKITKNPRGQEIEEPLPSVRLKPTKPFACYLLLTPEICGLNRRLTYSPILHVLCARIYVSQAYSLYKRLAAP
jgi:hypothetical protein